MSATPARRYLPPPKDDAATPSAAAFLAIGAVTSLEFFETGMVTFAAGPIMGGLGLGAEGLALSFTVYAVAAIFMLYKHQWVVERWGYRNFTLASLLLFALGAIVCATADALPQFLVGRVVQGAAGATFFTAGRLEVNRVPLQRRFGAAMSFISGLFTGSMLAPLAATWLIAAFSWRAVFWVVPPLAALIALLAQRHLSRRTAPHAERSEEHWGWLLALVLSMLALQLALHDLQFAASAGHILAFGLPACLALGLFAWRQWHKERPLIDVRALFQWRYLLGLLFYFIGYFLSGATAFLLPIFAQQALGLSMAVTAAVVSLSFAGGLLVALIHAVLARRWPRHRLYILIGLVLSGIGNLLLSRLLPGADWPALLLPALLGGAAAAFFFGPVAFNTFATIDQRAFSHAYQVKNIVRQLGLSAAVAVSALLLQSPLVHRLGHVPDGSGSAAAPAAWVAHLLGAGRAAAEALPGQVLFVACSNTFLLLALLALPAMLLAWWQKVFR